MTAALDRTPVYADEEAIRDRFRRLLDQQLFDTWLRGTRLTGWIEAVRFLGPDVALLHATG